MTRKILDVPKVKQLPDYCLPASVSMVLMYYGISVDQEEIAKEISPYELGGFKNCGILEYTEIIGVKVKIIENCSIEHSINMVDNDIPPIIRATSLVTSNMAHMSVIKGYDLDYKRFIFNDPRDLRRSNLGFKFLESIWVVDNKHGYSKNRAYCLFNPGKNL